MNTFETLAQLSMAFVAFATIVITVRTSTGGKLTQFQLLLTHFYIEVGLMAAGLSATALVLLEAYGDTPAVWQISTYLCILSIIGYMPFYFMRRARIKAPTPLITILVSIGYVIVGIALVITATGKLWQPSMSMTAGYVLWILFSSGLIFVKMLEDFMGTAVED